ncbi:MAG TPA: hypothetical protein VIG32_08705 [Candidatus Baltobacteraceae bacterium]|jgi:hypothetical protein
MAQQKTYSKVQAAVGFAADPGGYGVAYARLKGGRGERLVRVPFRVTRFPALLDREVGYAALTAVAAHLRERGVAAIEIAVDDAHLATDLRERRELPQALSLAYVRLGCTLNQFRDYSVVDGAGTGDLTARARAEVAMHVAA